MASNTKVPSLLLPHDHLHITVELCQETLPHAALEQVQLCYRVLHSASCRYLGCGVSNDYDFKHN